MNSDSRLSVEQARAAEFASLSRHVLVLARPGSGKTYTLAARARHLLERGFAPEQLLAMTFSRRAALELKDRLPGGEIWAGTFHAICADILEKHGAAIGVHWPFRIVDEVRASEILIRAAHDVGYPLPNEGGKRERYLRELRGRIERRKRLGADRHSSEPGELLPPRIVASIDDRYCEILKESRSLDFDDLLVQAVKLLQQDQIAAEVLRNRLRFLLIDEFHDISPEQYMLITLLAPSRFSSQVFVVGDPDQAIYNWRGADISRMLRQFRGEYQPEELHLTTNYRSRSPIVAAADALMSGYGRTRQSKPARTGAVKPCFCSTVDSVAEAEEIVAAIQRARESGAFPNFGNFAVLYRAHAVGDEVEKRLLQAEIPVWRVQRQRFFADPDAQESLRSMELALGLHSEDFEPALNWPRVLVDEVTMARLRRMSASRGLTLIELMRTADTLSDELSALTRGAIREFLATLGRDLEPLMDFPIGSAYGPFLNVLKARRSPVATAERPLLRDTLDLLEPPLRTPAQALFKAVKAGRPIAIQCEHDPDAVAAGVIVEHVLASYFGVTVILDHDEPRPSASFSVVLGANQGMVADGVSLTPLQTRTVDLNLATRAWRLMQMVLMLDEAFDDGSTVLFDVETTSADPRRAEILEYAVVPLDIENAAPGDELVGLMRPSSPTAITRQSTDIHGLRWSDVVEAPAAIECLPQMIAKLDGTIVIGHGIQEFDLVVLRQSAARAGLTMVEMATIDTRMMAQRLWPDELSYRLEDLVRRCGPYEVQAHRARDDCRITGKLFAELVRESLRHRETESLLECLPVVAGSLLARENVPDNDNALLVELGKRSLSQGLGIRLLSRWETLVEPRLVAGIRRKLNFGVTEDPEERLRWDRLEQGWQRAVEALGVGESDQSIGRFLHYAALAQPIDVSAHVTANGDLEPGQLTKQERVTLMTIHSAKGLEWPVVFLAGVEDDLMPGFRATTEAEIEDERRVLYVGMTRARDRLLMFSAEQRRGYGKQASRFLNALIPEKVQAVAPSGNSPTRS